MWLQPIYDRTLTDVKLKTSKAFINTEDLNRIEENIGYLSDILKCNLTVKHWQDGEFIFTSDIDRIEKNISALIKTYPITDKSPDFPKPPVNTYSRFNDIEKIIYDIYSLFYANKSAVYFCAETYAGAQIGVI